MDGNPGHGAVRDAALDLMRTGSVEAWPTVAQVAFTAMTSEDEVLQVVRASSDMAVHGDGDPSSRLVSVTSYEARRDPGHPVHWDRILGSDGRGEVVDDILRACLCRQSPGDTSVPVVVLTGTRHLWMVTVTDVLSPEDPPDQGSAGFRIRAFLGDGTDELETVVLDTPDLRDLLTVTTVLGAELRDVDPERRPPLFVSGGRPVFNPLREAGRSGRPNGRAYREGWDGIPSPRGVHLRHPTLTYGQDYLTWRDGVLRRFMRESLRMPQDAGQGAST